MEYFQTDKDSTIVLIVETAIHMLSSFPFSDIMLTLLFLFWVPKLVVSFWCSWAVTVSCQHLESLHQEQHGFCANAFFSLTSGSPWSIFVCCDAFTPLLFLHASAAPQSIQTVHTGRLLHVPHAILFFSVAPKVSFAISRSAFL